NNAHHTLSFANGGNPIYAYGVTIDRSANTASYVTLHSPGSTNIFWIPDVITTDDTYIYCACSHDNNGVFSLEVEKRLASDWSLVSTASIAGLRGVTSDIDLATIGGVQYLAITYLESVANKNDVYVIKTSDMSVVYSYTR